MLLANATPQDVVVRKVLPLASYLGGAAQGSGVEITEYFQTDLTGEDCKGIDADEMRELLGEQRELGEAAHGEEALEDEGPLGMRGGRKVGPDGVDRFALCDGERI